MEGLEDPRLRRAVPRTQWQIGSVVEIYSNTERKWNVGHIIEWTLHGVRVLFIDGNSKTETQNYKVKTVGHDDSQQLASVGANVRRLPPSFELTADHDLFQRSTGRRFSTYEKAWKAHFDCTIRTLPAAAPSGITARAVKSPCPVGPQQQLLSAQLVASVAAPAAVSNPTMLKVQSPGSENVATGSLSAPSAPAREVSLPDQIARLQQSLEESERMRQVEADEAKRKQNDFQEQIEELKRVLEETRQERNQFRQFHREQEFQKVRRNDKVSIIATLEDSVLLENEESNKGDMAAGIGKPLIEKPVEVSFRVPRALTPEEMIEGARHFQNLAPGVMRMPSAPAQPISSAAATASHRLSMAGHRASVALVAVAPQQPHHVVQQTLQKHTFAQLNSQAHVLTQHHFQAVPMHTFVGLQYSPV